MPSVHTIYLIVVDVTKPIEEINQEIDFWKNYIRRSLNLSSTSKPIPIIIVGNKMDLLSNDKQKKFNDYFNEIPSEERLHKFLTSGKTWHNVTRILDLLRLQLRSFITTHLKNLPREEVPELYIKAMKEALNQKAQGKLLVRRSHLESMAPYTFLHKAGIILFNPATSIVCVNPVTLALAIFCFEIISSQDIRRHYTRDVISYLAFD